MDQWLKWVPLGIAVFSAGIAWGAHKRAGSQMLDRVNEARREFKSSLERQTEHHAAHFESIRVLQNNAAALTQEVRDHHVLDNSRFEQLTVGMTRLEEESVRGRESIHALREDLHQWMMNERKQ